MDAYTVTRTHTCMHGMICAWMDWGRSEGGEQGGMDARIDERWKEGWLDGRTDGCTCIPGFSMLCHVVVYLRTRNSLRFHVLI